MALPLTDAMTRSAARGTAARRPLALLASARGWSLVDVLLSTIFTALLAAILHSNSIASLQVLRVRAVADDLDENARIALEIIARDVRETGYGVGIDAGLRFAGPTRVLLGRDLDLDGATASPGELLGYEIDGAARQLRRQAGSAPPQPMVDDLVPETVAFRFRDATGAELTAPGGIDDPGGLDEEQRRAVRQIEVTLRLEAPHPVPGAGTISAQHSVVAGLRNADL